MDLTRLDELRQAEENNFAASVERLGDTATLAEDFSDAYEAIARLLRDTNDPPAHLFVVTVLFLAARYQLERAVLDVFRARLSDGFQATRRAAEVAAFAAKIHRHPHLADVWLHAAKGEAEYEEYRKKFSKDLWPDDDELLSRLYSRYDHASRQFHGSPFSVGGRASIHTKDKSIEFGFRTFEIGDDDAEPASSLLWVLDTHFGILKVFVRVLEEQLGSGVAGWAVRETALDAKLGAHRKKWEGAIRRRIADNEDDVASDSA